MSLVIVLGHYVMMMDCRIFFRHRRLAASHQPNLLQEALIGDFLDREYFVGTI